MESIRTPSWEIGQAVAQGKLRISSRGAAGEDRVLPVLSDRLSGNLNALKLSPQQREGSASRRRWPLWIGGVTLSVGTLSVGWWVQVQPFPRPAQAFSSFDKSAPVDAVAPEPSMPSETAVVATLNGFSATGTFRHGRAHRLLPRFPVGCCASTFGREIGWRWGNC